jgi:hypothetical protein
MTPGLSNHPSFDQARWLLRARFIAILAVVSFLLAVASAYPDDRPSSVPAMPLDGVTTVRSVASSRAKLPPLAAKDNPSLHLSLARPQALWFAPSSKYVRTIAQNNSGIANSAGQVTTHWTEHNFWDHQNKLLFGAVAASRTLDYFSTLNMRRRGLQEIFLTNDIVDNHAAFAAIEASGTAISIGASYLFHRYHHHRLERWTSIIHASLATTGAVRNYCLQTAHPSSAP